jgi:hypothetical protein
MPLVDSSGYMLWPPGIFPPPGIGPSEVNSPTTTYSELDTRQNPQESKLSFREKKENFFLAARFLMAIYGLLMIKIDIENDALETRQNALVL